MATADDNPKSEVEENLIRSRIEEVKRIRREIQTGKRSTASPRSSTTPRVEASKVEQAKTPEKVAQTPNKPRTVPLSFYQRRLEAILRKFGVRYSKKNPSKAEAETDTSKSPEDVKPLYIPDLEISVLNRKVKTLANAKKDLSQKVRIGDIWAAIFGVLIAACLIWGIIGITSSTIAVGISGFCVMAVCIVACIAIGVYISNNSKKLSEANKRLSWLLFVYQCLDTSNPVRKEESKELLWIARAAPKPRESLGRISKAVKEMADTRKRLSMVQISEAVTKEQEEVAKGEEKPAEASSKAALNEAKISIQSSPQDDKEHSEDQTEEVKPMKLDDEEREERQDSTEVDKKPEVDRNETDLPNRKVSVATKVSRVNSSVSTPSSAQQSSLSYDALFVAREIRLSDEERRYRFLRFFWGFSFLASALILIVVIVSVAVGMAALNASGPSDVDPTVNAVLWAVLGIFIFLFLLNFILFVHYHRKVKETVDKRKKVNNLSRPRNRK